jgi:phage tail-like protein
MYAYLSNFHFKVEWGGSRTGFLEVTGLGMGVDVAPYREGASPEFATTLTPGQKHYSPVVLKRAMVAGDNDFYSWISSAQVGEVERRDVLISLLNSRHEPVMLWKLVRAFPSRLDYAPLNALGSDLATESLTLVHEGLAVLKI